MNEITSLNLYLITRLDNIILLIYLLCVFASTALIILYMVEISDIDDNKDFKKNYKYKKQLTLFIIISLVINTLIPTTKEMIMIKVLPKIANNKALSTDVKKLYNISIKTTENKIKGINNGTTN